MENGIVRRAGGNMLPFMYVLGLLLHLWAAPARGEAVPMRNYCNVPPLPGFSVRPNLLLLIDNSASMYDLAYTDPGNFCVDDTFDKTRDYPGYFETGAFYRYALVSGRFEPLAGGIPNSAKCAAVGAAECSFLCVDLKTAAGKTSLDTFIASGNFLNWLSMSKLDVEKKILTGGKYDPGTGLLQAETRGCQGKRFIKMAGSSNLTFAVRGPVFGESDYVYRESQGGLGRIEVYTRKYNKDACLAAVSAWQAGEVKLLADQVSLCMNDTYESDGETPTKGKIYAEILSACYADMAGHQTALDEMMPTLIEDCSIRILNRYYDDASRIKKNEGDQICGRAVPHTLLYYNGFPITYGYMGQCYMVGGMGFIESCARWQAGLYCQELSTSALTDPSVTANLAGTAANVPGFVLEAGVYSLGEAVGTLQARLIPQAPPTGLVQEYQDRVNVGAMTFKGDGAGAECGSATGVGCAKHCKNDPEPRRQCYLDSDCTVKTAGSCAADAKLDGGRIVSYLNHSPVGDHASGLVAAIDEIRADSWTPLAEAFYETIGYFGNRTDLRLQESAFDPAFPPSRFSCQKNNVLIVTDGMSSADRAPAVNEFVSAAVASWGGSGGMPASLVTTGADATGATPAFAGSYNLDDLAWVARNKNIFDPLRPIVSERDYITTHAVYTGIPCGKAGACPGDERDPEKLVQLAAAKGGGTAFSATRPDELQKALRDIFETVEGASAGTDASILATGEGNGALFLQEQFYRCKSFDGGATRASWVGEMQGLWYFIDPFIASSGSASAVREDTNSDRVLDLKQDSVVKYYFDEQQKSTRARIYRDSNGDGNLDPHQPQGFPLDVAPEEVRTLWRAGLKLWEREAATRSIYTQIDGRDLVALPSLDLSKSANYALLQAESGEEAGRIVSFVTGVDGAGTRSRGVAISGSQAKVWKLGDIVNSTPVMQTVVGLGNYHLSPGYADKSYAGFIGDDAYKARGTVYVGANDGMLHAFRLGTVSQRPEGEETWPATKKAVLVTEKPGEELWAFVPRGALPYLRYLKEPLYPHLFLVDGPTLLADASIGDPVACGVNSYWNCQKGKTSWRTVLIGSMGLGGASRRSDDDTCTEGSAGSCVKAPPTGGGLSSYFALDVTGQTAGAATEPRLLWEFSHPALGFTTSGAALIKVNAQSGNPPKDDPDKNGRWFAVFASGPVGPIDPASCRFLGSSDQNLKLFVVDLNAAPPLTLGNNYWLIDTKIKNAFGGSMSRAGIDADRWKPSAAGFYEDEALYLGYSRLADDGSWTGGVLRVLTRESPDPAQWLVSKVIDGIGPVTGSVAKVQDRGNRNLWLYFGTGRFFHGQDDLAAPRALFGVKEPCYDREDNRLPTDNSCSAPTLALSDLVDMTENAQGSVPDDRGGWWIGLDRSAGGAGSERTTANPVALGSGAVFYTTFKPATDICSQPQSFLWGVKYDTGGSIPEALKATALVPLSTGASADLGLSALSERRGRRSAPLPGKPAGVKLISNSGLRPLKKIIHMQER